MRTDQLYKYEKHAFIVIIILVIIAFFSSCKSVPYNTVYNIKAKQIIRGESYLTGYEEHVISDKTGKVYRIFQAPGIPKDSIYKVVKRMSYGRERSLEYYYKIVKPKKNKK